MLTVPSAALAASTTARRDGPSLLQAARSAQSAVTQKNAAPRCAEGRGWRMTAIMDGAFSIQSRIMILARTLFKAGLRLPFLPIGGDSADRLGVVDARRPVELALCLAVGKAIVAADQIERFAGDRRAPGHARRPIQQLEAGRERGGGSARHRSRPRRRGSPSPSTSTPRSSIWRSPSSPCWCSSDWRPGPAAAW